MDAKLIAALACAAALALGACSGNPPAGPTGADRGTPDDDTNGGTPDDDNGDSGSAELERLRDGATRAIARAMNAAPGERAGARTEIETARKAIDDAVAEARRVSAANPNDLTAYDRLTHLLALQRTQTPDLEDALDSLAWFGRTLARYVLASGEAVTPRESTNVVTINRIPRTRTAAGGGQERNPDAFTSTTFKTVMHEDGKKVFSDVDVEFKVDGYTQVSFSTYTLEPYMYTGVKLTRDGLVIRTGGTKPSADVNIRSDFADMRRDITRQTDDTNNSGNVNASDGLPGQNGWDLEIMFNAPQTPMPVPDAPDGKNWVASWQGNGDFYWKAIAPADEDKQLAEDGDYYESDAFNQPDGYKDLGTYQVWLSNHAGVDTKLEPPSGQEGTYPEDDEQFYLEYAAYGLFVYTADPETFRGPAHNGRQGRAQSLHFGYSAFANEEDKQTTDIGETITGGKFKGQALAYAYKGVNTSNEFKMLRGDATLTVNIPKKTGMGNISGNLNNFKEWTGTGWKVYGTNFNVRLVEADITYAGTFTGTATATGGVNLSGAGVFKGAFYGPRDDRADLEVAGSWSTGHEDTGNNSGYDMMGSFGAKQRPAPVLADSGPSG